MLLNLICLLVCRKIYCSAVLLRKIKPSDPSLGICNQEVENCILRLKLMRPHSVLCGPECPVFPAEETERKPAFLLCHPMVSALNLYCGFAAWNLLHLKWKKKNKSNYLNFYSIWFSTVLADSRKDMKIWPQLSYCDVVARRGDVPPTAQWEHIFFLSKHF